MFKLPIKLTPETQRFVRSMVLLALAAFVLREDPELFRDVAVVALRLLVL